MQRYLNQLDSSALRKPTFSDTTVVLGEPKQTVDRKQIADREHNNPDGSREGEIHIRRSKVGETAESKRTGSHFS